MSTNFYIYLCLLTVAYAFRFCTGCLHIHYLSKLCMGTIYEWRVCSVNKKIIPLHALLTNLWVFRAHSQGAGTCSRGCCWMAREQSLSSWCMPSTLYHPGSTHKLYTREFYSLSGTHLVQRVLPCSQGGLNQTQNVSPMNHSIGPSARYLLN